MLLLSAVLCGVRGAVGLLAVVLSPVLLLPRAVSRAARKPPGTAEEAACPFSELALSCGLEAENVVGKVGTVNKQTAPASQYSKLPPQAAVHHVVNPVLKAAYARKKKALAARLGAAANVNEQFLFHGTSLANSEAIIRNNFCLSQVRAQSRCRCVWCVLSLKGSSLIILTHRARVRLDETLAARWETTQATQGIS
jgi:hypothetical protein